MYIINNIPNLLTLFNLLCGCIAIVFASTNNLIWSAYMVGFACVFDFLDGLVARLLKANSELGKQLDSLADMVSFGVVPGVIMYKMILYSQILASFTDVIKKTILALGEENNLLQHVPEVFHLNILAITGFLITIFSAIRLAKYNIDTRQGNSFIGLPTPANAIFIASIPLIPYASLPILSEIITPYFLVSLTFISSFFLIAPIHFFAIKFKNFLWTDNKIRYIFLALSLSLLILFKFAGIPLIIILYIILSIINNIVTRNKTQQS
ncbi:MAG: CDP-alcohol phosphatidyltransferase family protein [Bacteroidota bacterium]